MKFESKASSIQKKLIQLRENFIKDHEDELRTRRRELEDRLIPNNECFLELIEINSHAVHDEVGPFRQQMENALVCEIFDLKQNEALRR